MPFPFDNVPSVGILSSASIARRKRNLPFVPKQDKQDPPPPPPPDDLTGASAQDKVRDILSGRFTPRGAIITDPTPNPISVVDPKSPDVGITIQDASRDPITGNRLPPDFDPFYLDARDYGFGPEVPTPILPPVPDDYEPPKDTPIIKAVLAGDSQPDPSGTPGEGKKRKCYYTEGGAGDPHKGIVQVHDEFGFIKNIYWYTYNRSTRQYEPNPELEQYGIDSNSLGTPGGCKMKRRPNFHLTGPGIDFSARYPAQDAVRLDIKTPKELFDEWWGKYFKDINSIEDLFIRDMIAIYDSDFWNFFNYFYNSILSISSLLVGDDSFADFQKSAIGARLNEISRLLTGLSELRTKYAGKKDILEWIEREYDRLISLYMLLLNRYNSL